MHNQLIIISRYVAHEIINTSDLGEKNVQIDISNPIFFKNKKKVIIIINTEYTIRRTY